MFKCPLFISLRQHRSRHQDQFNFVRIGEALSRAFRAFEINSNPMTRSAFVATLANASNAHVGVFRPNRPGDRLSVDKLLLFHERVNAGDR